MWSTGSERNQSGYKSKCPSKLRTGIDGWSASHSTVVFAAPALAVIAVVVLAAASVARRWPRLTIAVVAACCLSTAALAETTRRRNLDYSSAERMWADTVAKRPESARVRVAYAIELMAAGRTGEAATHLRAALSLDPETNR